MEPSDPPRIWDNEDLEIQKSLLSFQVNRVKFGTQYEESTIMDWCELNIGDQDSAWSLRYQFDTDLDKMTISQVWNFRTEEDAVFFSLRWLA